MIPRLTPVRIALSPVEGREELSSGLRPALEGRIEA